jgi:hypothetical protein
MSCDEHVMIFILGSHRQPLSLLIQKTGKLESDQSAGSGIGVRMWVVDM